MADGALAHWSSWLSATSDNARECAIGRTHSPRDLCSKAPFAGSIASKVQYCTQGRTGKTLHDIRRCWWGPETYTWWCSKLSLSMMCSVAPPHPSPVRTSRRCRGQCGPMLAWASIRLTSPHRRLGAGVDCEEFTQSLTPDCRYLPSTTLPPISDQT